MSSTLVRNKKNKKFHNIQIQKQNTFFFLEEIQIRKQKLDELRALF